MKANPACRLGSIAKGVIKTSAESSWRDRLRAPGNQLLKPVRYLISALTVVLSVAALHADVITLNPIADTDSQSDVAAGTNANICVSQYCIPFYKFNLSSVTGSITNGKLRIYFPSGTAATTLTVSTTSNDSWVEGGTKPTQGSTIATKAISATGAGYVEVDLTSYVQTKYSGTKIVSVALSNTISSWTGVTARESAANKPQLVVTTNGTGGGGTTTSNLNPVADTDSQSDPASGTNAGLNVSQYCTPFFKFDLTSVTGTVSAGTLRVYFGGGTPSTTYTVSATSNDSWTEGSAKPNVGASITSKPASTAVAGYIDFDITSYVQTKVAANKIVSVALSNTLGGWTGINSRESTANKPILVVTTGSGGGTTVLVSSISLTPGTTSVAQGSTATITANVQPANATNRTLSWSSTNPGVASVSATGVVTGQAVGSASIKATSTDGSNITSNTVAVSVTAGGGGGTVTRPSYNTGTGFFVLNGKLYDANGKQFIIRGVNKLHWDATTPGIPNTGANTVRYVIDFNQPTSTNLALVQQSIDAHMVPMPGNWGVGSCPDESQLPGIVSTWISQSAAWKTIDRYMILNIANELGGGNSTAWRDAYITAIGRLRTAGYLCTICVDAGGCGQDNDDLANFAQSVFNSDPQKNVIFSQHIYGNWGTGGNPSWATDLDAGLNRLAATGLCFIVGEFGPGRNIGPSPTLMTPGQIITAANSRGFGWLAWAWDDPPTPSDDNWFSMSKNGYYNSTNDLTTFGKDVVENPTYGLKATAVKQTAF